MILLMREGKITHYLIHNRVIKPIEPGEIEIDVNKDITAPENKGEDGIK